MFATHQFSGVIIPKHISNQRDAYWSAYHGKDYQKTDRNGASDLAGFLIFALICIVLFLFMLLAASENENGLALLAGAMSLLMFCIATFGFLPDFLKAKDLLSLATTTNKFSRLKTETETLHSADHKLCAMVDREVKCLNAILGIRSAHQEQVMAGRAEDPSSINVIDMLIARYYELVCTDILLLKKRLVEDSWHTEPDINMGLLDQQLESRHDFLYETFHKRLLDPKGTFVLMDIVPFILERMKVLGDPATIETLQRIQKETAVTLTQKS